MSNNSQNEKILKYKRIRARVKIAILLMLIIICILFIAKKNLLLSTFNLVGEENITLKTGDKYVEQGVDAKFLMFDVSNKILVDNKLDTSKVGDYKIKYKIKIVLLNIDKTIYRNIKVIDGIAPELTIEQEEVKLNLGDNYNRPGFKAIDNVDGDITSKVVIEGSVDTNNEGDYIEKIKATDSSGNETTKEIKVKVEAKYKHSKIVVNKTTQYLEYYEYDNLVYGTYVVTGNDYNTPLGTFKINNKIPRAKLIGENNEYEVDVNYWMAFIGSSHGFHDAPWRSTFGGSVYLYDPSHGCINLPTYAARDLYYMVEIGTPVYIIR